MLFNCLPTQETIRKLLNYDLETGVFTWNHRVDAIPAWNISWAGSVAGVINGRGYRVITIQYKLFRAHRLAWVYVYGNTLDQNTEIDHINGDRGDNRISNLRLSTKSQNQANSKKKGQNGLPKGVQMNKSRFMSRIMVNRKLIYLGTFDTPEEASFFYNYAAQYYHGEFARVA